MDECKDTWYPFSWYCPNCGTQLIGFKNAEGMIKVECKRCLAVSVRKVMGRRHNRIDVYAPKGQEDAYRICLQGKADGAVALKKSAAALFR